MQTLTGLVAVVTGAASGIGRGIVDSFVAEGMKVVLADVQQEALDAAVDAVREAGGDAMGIRCDVSDRSQVEELAARTLESFGHVHVVCNNAGVESGAPFAEIPLDTWEWVMGVNLGGVINGCRVFLPLLRRESEGHIVNTSSIGALNAYMPTGAPYVASKMAVVGLSENLHAELDGLSVGLSLLCPGFVRSNLASTSASTRPRALPAVPESAVRRVIGEAAMSNGAVGLDPRVVGDEVVDAIRTGRLYILPHKDEAIDAVEQRLRWMTDNVPPGPPPGLLSARQAYTLAAEGQHS